MREYIRPFAVALGEGLRRRAKLIHVVLGARQTGKTTAADQIASTWEGPAIQASADLSG